MSDNTGLADALRKLAEELRKASEILRPLTDSEIVEFLTVGVETLDPDIAEDEEVSQEIAAQLYIAAQEL